MILNLCLENQFLANSHKNQQVLWGHDLFFQVNALARCTTRSHVENLKAIHLSSITDVIKAINHQVDVSSCSVYTEKTIITAVTSSSNEVRDQIPHKTKLLLSTSLQNAFWSFSGLQWLRFRSIYCKHVAFESWNKYVKDLKWT